MIHYTPTAFQLAKAKRDDAIARDFRRLARSHTKAEAMQEVCQRYNIGRSTAYTAINKAKALHK